MDLGDSLWRLGGFRIGWVNGTLPFGLLRVRPDELTLHALGIGSYSFRPDQVLALEPVFHFPLVGHGLRIRHVVADRPETIIFWHLGWPAWLIARIEAVGFRPTATEKDLPLRDGMAWRWQGLLAFFFAWVLLMVADMSLGNGRGPGWIGRISFLLVAVGCVGIWRSAVIRSFFLKPGRSLGELRHVLVLLGGITGLVFLLSLGFF